MEEHRLLPRFRRAVRDAAAAKAVAPVLLELGETLPAAVSSYAVPGDPFALRGLPVVGVRGGVGGAIADTRPDMGSRELDAWIAARRRPGSFADLVREARAQGSGESDR